MTVHWKYGKKTTVTMRIANAKDDPIYLAELVRRKRERSDVQNALPEKASALMTSSDRPQGEVIAAPDREAMKHERQGKVF